MTQEIKFATHFEPNRNNFRFTNFLEQPKHLIDNVNRLNFVFSDAGLNVVKTQLFNTLITENELNNYDRLSLFGLPVFSYLTLSTEKYGDITIDGVIISVNKTRNSTKTRLAGNSTNKIQYHSEGDYTISITGVITNDNLNTSSYPYTNVQHLINNLTSRKEIDVYNILLDKFGIKKIVISDFSFPQQRGTLNAQTFYVNALSDDIDDLYILEEDKKESEYFDDVDKSVSNNIV